MAYIDENGDRDADFTLMDEDPLTGQWRVCASITFLYLFFANINVLNIIIWFMLRGKGPNRRPHTPTKCK